MFDKTAFQTLYDYHWHTCAQLLDCAGRLSEADYLEDTGYGHGSVHDLLYHVLATDMGWRLGIETGRQQFPIQPEEYPNLPALRTAFGLEQSAWTALLDGLSDRAIESSISVVNWREQNLSMPLWQLLQHVLLHGMQHHAEIAQALMRKNLSPGNLDLLHYFIARNSEGSG